MHRMVTVSLLFYFQYKYTKSIVNPNGFIYQMTLKDYAGYARYITDEVKVKGYINIQRLMIYLQLHKFYKNFY